MKHLKKNLILSFISVSMICQAQNPIIQTMYTADPAPMVYNDKLYIYTTHDEDNSTWFTMDNWKLYSTDDMVNWTDHGVVLSYTDFEWAKGDAWAPQCIERNGKFYMYVPVTSKVNNRSAIGVAVADTPMGPFYDALGAPLVQTDWGDIDPTVFIDDDGQAYLYWGNPKLYYIKLNEDMISYKGEVVSVPMTVESFGERKDTKRPTSYEEGPWLYKRNDLYYLFWPGGPLPEFIGYSTSKSPTGPWKYGDILMPAQGGSFTIHPGVVDFRGKTYYFYHNGMLPGGGGFNRSVCVEELKFNKDGSIPQLNMTKEGITQGVATLNPYQKTEAETIAWSEGIKASQNDQVGVFVIAKKNGAFIKVRDVDFRKTGATKFFARVANTHNANVTMEIHQDKIDGPLLGTLKIPRTGGSNRWSIVSVDVPRIEGVHDIYFVFKGPDNTDVMYFDYWRFAE